MATKKKSKADVAVYVPLSPMGEAVVAGDVDAVSAALLAVDRHQWPMLRKEANAALAHVSQGEWGQLPGTTNSYGFITVFTNHQRAAAAHAVMIVGSAADAADAVHHKDIDDVMRVFTAFRPAHLPELAQVLVQHRWPKSDLAQRLITAGMSARPTSDAYILSLIQWSGSVWHRQRKGEDISFASLVRSDPGLITDGVLLRLFDVEGTRDISLGIHDKYGKDDSWASVLIGLVTDGLLDRAVVIDKTLQAIERDWPQFRTGWYLGFLDALALSADERRRHAERFLGLLSSRIGPTVSVALDVVSALVATRDVDSVALLSALTPVMAARGKGQVKTALKLASKVANDITRDAVQALAIAALVNEDADVQGLALDLLAAPRAAQVDDELHANSSLIVPRHRARFDTMMGITAAAPSAKPASQTPMTTKKKQAIDPLDPLRRVLPPPALDDLVDLVARAIEDDSDPVVVERAFAGLALHALDVAAHPAPWAALRKRAPKIHRALSSTIAALLLAILDDSELDDEPVTDAAKLLHARAREARAVVGGRALVPLATPTHLDGVVEAATVIQRVREHVAAGVNVDALVYEGQLALYRLGPVDDANRAAAATLPASLLTRALRDACGMGGESEDDVTRSPFGLAASVRRHGPWSLSTPPTLQFVHRPRTDGGEFIDVRVVVTEQRLKLHPQALRIADVPRERFHAGFVGGDLASVRYGLTLWPTGVEALLVDGVSAIANNLDWWGAQWHDRGYLEALQSPWVACTSSTSMATSLLALGLCGKEPGQTAVSVDGLVKGLGDGRVDIDALGAALSALLDEGVIKAKRLAAALKAASASDDDIADDIRRLLEGTLSGDAARAPRDLGALLSLLVHLRVLTASPLPTTTARYLQALTGGGQVAKDKKLLLA